MVDPQPDARRLRGFKLHLQLYALVMVALVALALLSGAATPWFVLPLVAWGAPLAVHAAWAMGLFTRRK